MGEDEQAEHCGARASRCSGIEGMMGGRTDYEGDANHSEAHNLIEFQGVRTSSSGGLSGRYSKSDIWRAHRSG